MPFFERIISEQNSDSELLFKILKTSVPVTLTSKQVENWSISELASPSKLELLQRLEAN